jgi:hypothetical protein
MAGFFYPIFRVYAEARPSTLFYASGTQVLNPEFRKRNSKFPKCCRNLLLMENHQVQFQLIQRQRAARQPQGNAEIILHLTDELVRILQIQADERILLLGLDEIRFTRSLSAAGKVEQFQQFVPESLLGEARFPRICMAVEPVSFSLIPKELFDVAAAGDLLRLAGNWAEQDGIFFEEVHPGIILVFSPGKEWLNYATEIFDTSEIRWTTSFSGMLRYAASMEEDALLACIGPASMHAFGKRAGRLEFFNRFNFRNEQDLLYYVLLSMEQSGLDPEVSPVKLCGSIMPGSAGFEKISRFVGNISFAMPPELLSELPPSSGIRHPQFFDLLSLL